MRPSGKRVSANPHKCKNAPPGRGSPTAGRWKYGLPNTASGGNTRARRISFSPWMSRKNISNAATRCCMPRAKSSHSPPPNKSGNTSQNHERRPQRRSRDKSNVTPISRIVASNRSMIALTSGRGSSNTRSSNGR